MKKALKYLISVIIAIIVAGFFIYLLIPALTGFMTLVGIVVVIAIVITVVKKRHVCEYLKPHAKKVYELVDTDGEYIGLRTIHPLFAGQRFSGKWEFRNFVFPEEK